MYNIFSLLGEGNHLTLINTVNTMTLSEGSFMRFNGKSPIFEQIAQYYETLIDKGVFVMNQEMPSIREVALVEMVNPNTVQRAFTKMVEDGYLRAIPKKGFYVLKTISERDRLNLLKEKLTALLKEGYSKEEIIKTLEEDNQ